MAGARTMAARPVRHRFEPTDLEMEEPGVLDIDLQFGLVQGPSTSRLVAPDFELDLGIARHLELDVDGAYAFDEYDPVWLSLKLSAGWLGAQIGPKLPVGSQDGIGAEALVLASAHGGACTGVVNLGAFVDPAPAGASARPVAIQGGLTLDVEIGAVTPHIEVGAVGFLSDDPNQLVVAAGVVWSVRPDLDLSL